MPRLPAARSDMFNPTGYRRSATSQGEQDMILSEKFNFAFVHIPKCAGMSMRSQIEKADPTCLVLHGRKTYPELGRIDITHMPLHLLRTHFPEYHGFLTRTECYAVTRDPLLRFGSAMRQTIWYREHEAMTLMTPDRLRRVALEILEEADRQIDALPYQLTYFQRQIDFVIDEGRQVVQNLYPIERVDALMRDLGERMGTRFDQERRANQNVNLKYKSLGPLAFRINHLMSRHMPTGLHQRLKDMALKVIRKPENPADESGLLDWPEVRDFVETHYAEDRRLHRATLDRFTDRPPHASA